VAGQLNNRLNTLIAELNNNPGPRVDHILAELRPLQDILTNLIREREGTFEEYREAAYIESRAFEDQLQVRFAFPDITGNRFHLAPLIDLAITVTEGELSVLSENTLSIDNLERARNTTNALRHTLSRLLEHHNAVLGPNNPRTIHLSAVVTSLEGQITSYSLAISNTEIWGYAHTRRHFIDNIISLHVSNITNLNYYRNTP
jgi:ABC-type transporter Mla subunit MlaD